MILSRYFAAGASRVSEQHAIARCALIPALHPVGSLISARMNVGVINLQVRI